MKREAPWLLAAVVGAAILAAVGSFRLDALQTALVVLVLVLGIIALSRLMATPLDREWLTRVVVLGFVAKLAGAGLRYWMVVGLYESGDSLRYHRVASQLVHQWRAFEIPRSTSPGGAGTHFVEVLTGLIYVPYIPTFLGAFFIFGTLSFLGQLGLYAGFRKALPPTGLKTYAILIFFLPSLVFWPASVGKEAFTMFAIGIFAVGAGSLLTEYRFRSAIAVSLGTIGAAVVRPHIGFLLLGSLGVAMLLAKRPPAPGPQFRRVIMIAAAGLVMISLATFVGERYDLKPTRESLDRFAEEVSRNTGQGGSEVEGSPVRTPLDVPGALLRVLFRPLPHEAHNTQAFLSSLESLGLRVLVAWRWPYVWKNLRAFRRYPYIALSIVFVAGFAVVFSPVLNLGILARQRTQALVFFLVVLVGLGWRREEKPAEDRSPKPAEVAGG
jgi:hypothetical protein